MPLRALLGKPGWYWAPVAQSHFPLGSQVNGCRASAEFGDAPGCHPRRHACAAATVPLARLILTTVSPTRRGSFFHKLNLCVVLRHHDDDRGRPPVLCRGTIAHPSQQASISPHRADDADLLLAVLVCHQLPLTVVLSHIVSILNTGINITLRLLRAKGLFNLALRSARAEVPLPLRASTPSATSGRQGVLSPPRGKGDIGEPGFENAVR